MLRSAVMCRRVIVWHAVNPNLEIWAGLFFREREGEERREKYDYFIYATSSRYFDLLQRSDLRLQIFDGE